jgi:hypothetical protein
MYTDTDSMFLYIESPDAYAEIRDTQNIRGLFDLSEVSETHPCQGFCSPNDINAGKVGYFKDETKGNPIIEFVALKPKMYSFTTCKPTLYHEGVPPPEIKEKRVVKGLSRAISSKLTHQNYLDMFYQSELQYHKNKRIQSKLHYVYTLEQDKRGLHPFDDKRYLLADIDDGRPNPYTHAYGHYEIENEVTHEEERTEPGEELVISDLTKKREEYFIRRHKLVMKRARITEPEAEFDDQFDISDEEPPEVTDLELEEARIAASKRPGLANRIRNIAQEIENRINGLKGTRSSQDQLYIPEIDLNAAGPSRIHLTELTPLIQNHSDSDDSFVDPRNPPPVVWPVSQRPPIAAPSSDAELFGELPELSSNELEQCEADINEEEANQTQKQQSTRKKKRRRKNPFIDDEAGDDGDYGRGSEGDDIFDYYDKFLVHDWECD